MLRVRLLAVAAAGVSALALASPASAQYVTPEPPRSGPAIDNQLPTQLLAEDVEVGAAAAGRANVAGTRRSGLPVTGGDVIGLTALGAGAIAAGTLLRRRHRQPSKT